ncbi:bacterial luciferase-like protein [Stipitochalara longipes BDJ]|nr:bacterial luciferase-like protein [Stipitochalara longipes BDJ]
MIADPPKKFQLNFYEVACAGSTNAIGQWKDLKDNTKEKDRLEYYLWLAKIAEKGKISSIFFADSYGNHEVNEGNADAQFKGRSHSLGFGITGSTSYIPPYVLARNWSTLDHITNGRIAWNIVTSFSKSSAEVFGLDNLLPHDERYLAAEEYMDIVYQLWEKSWEDGCQVFQEEPEMAYDPSKIHKISYQEKYHKFNGYGQTHPSPQRTPLIFQAGASKLGIQFGAKHAEAIFCSYTTIADCKKYTKSFFLVTMPFLGRTQEEAEAKFEAARKRASIQGGLTRFSGFANIDMSGYPIDEPFKFRGEMKENMIQGFIHSMQNLDEKTTPRDIGEILAFGGQGPRPVGTAQVVADELEKWAIEGDVDGFNLSPVSNPGSWEDIVELLVPELQKRGLYWEDYPALGRTLRENMGDKPGRPLLAEDHPGYKFKWNSSTSNGKATTNGYI